MSASQGRRLEGRVALITGASRGLGAALAPRFAAEGAHVVLVARTVGGLEATDDAVRAVGGSATLVPLDLQDHDRIDQMGASLFERFGRLDILIGNAGMLGNLSPMGHVDLKLWNRVMGLNVTANWRLIRSFDALLRASDAGRAIFTTDAVARTVSPYWAAYAVSKAALEKMVQTYASEVTKTPVKANLIDPGPLRTRLRTEAFPGENPQSLPLPATVADAFLALADPACTRQGEIVHAKDLQIDGES